MPKDAASPAWAADPQPTAIIRECVQGFAGKQFSSDWFVQNIPNWIEALAKFRDRPCEVLEIGSFEGRSAIFLLEYLRRCKLTCIDPFYSSDTERRFASNTADYASLVIQAGAMARGGDVFLLDMGEPVKIDELARSMIRLMGREVRDETHPYGDITIEYIGPRDGEKLYEELLIGEGVVATEHPRILRSQEPFLPRVELDALLADLEAAMEDGSKVAIQAVLMRAVESYCPERRPRPEPVPPREAA